MPRDQGAWSEEAGAFDMCFAQEWEGEDAGGQSAERVERDVEGADHVSCCVVANV